MEQEETDLSADPDDKKNFKQNLTGYVYQLKVLLLLLWRAFDNNIFNFQLGTELAEGEKLEDALFFYQNSVRYLQAKHARQEDKTNIFLTFDDFVGNYSRAKCNLRKYFISFRKLKQKSFDAKIHDLILCTNVPFRSLVLSDNGNNTIEFEDANKGTNKDDIFYDANLEKTPWKKYQLKDTRTCEKLDNNLKSATNLNLLANEIALYLFKDAKDPNMNFLNFWISSFFNTLMEERVIEVKNIFILKAENNLKTQKHRETNEDIRKLKNEIEESLNKNKSLKKYEDMTFEKKFVEELKKNKRKPKATMQEFADMLVNNIVIDKYFEKLNTLLVKAKGKCFVFTDEFINNAPTLEKNAKNFHNILMRACRSHIGNKLEKEKLFMSAGTTKLNIIDGNNEEDIADQIIQHLFYRTELNDVSLLSFLVKDGVNVYKFTADFIYDLNPTCFKDNFFSMYFKEMLRNKEIQFKQKISVMQNIVKEIKIHANDIVDGNVLNLDISRFEKTGLFEALNGSVFCGTKNKKRIAFKSSFGSPSKINNPYASEFLEKLEMTADELKELKKKEINFYNYPPYFNKLEENGMIDDDIMEFRKLFFIINTPNENDLLKVISEEMGETFNLIDSEIMTFELFQQVLNWAKRKEDKLLDGDDVKKFKEKMLTNLSQTLEAGCSLQYCEKLQDFSLSYNYEFTKLKKFLSLPPLIYNSNQILQMKTDNILLTSIKVCQTLKSCYSSKMDGLIFNPLTCLLRMQKAIFKSEAQNYVTKAFESRVNLLIIVDKEIKHDIRQFCEKLCDILQKKPEKKIVVISSVKSILISSLKNSKTESYRVKTNTYRHLTKHSQKSVLNQSVIKFQGNNVPLDELITRKEAKKLIAPKTLEKLITCEKIVVGDAVINFTELESLVYRPRKFQLIGVQEEILEKLKNDHIFVIEGEEIETWLEKKGHVWSSCNDIEISHIVKICTTDSKRCYHELSLKHPQKFIHWLRLVNGLLLWFCSHTPKKLPDIFKNQLYKSENYADESDILQYIQQNQHVVISDIAGMGKSTVLTKFLLSLQKEKRWITRINLNECTNTLLEIKNRFPNNQNSTPVLNFEDFNIQQSRDFGKIIIKSLTSKKESFTINMNFENRIFNCFFKKSKMLLIFDGFDEIMPDYKKEVLDLFHALKKDKKNKILVTSRTNFKNLLEDVFETLAYDLKPFDEKDQAEYLKIYWSYNWKIEKGYELPNQTLLDTYVYKLVLDAAQTLGDIIGIPLQTKILAEIFQGHANKDGYYEEDKVDEETITWPTCFDYVISDGNQKLDFTKKLENISILYEKFFEDKVFKYYLKGKGIVELNKPFAKKIRRLVYEDEYQAHKIFGVLAFCGQNFPEEVLENHEIKLKASWLQDFEKYVEHIGIIENFNADKHFRFIHTTYAEYFAACFLTDKFFDVNAKEESQKQLFEIANEISKKDLKVFVECFKCKLKNSEYAILKNGDTALKFATRHGLINCVNIFLNSKDFNDNFPDSDLSGNTTLNYAVIYQKVNVVSYLILHMLKMIMFVQIIPETIPHYLFKIIESVRNVTMLTENEEISNLFEDMKNLGEKYLKPKSSVCIKKIIGETRKKDLNLEERFSNAYNSEENIFIDVLHTLLKTLSFANAKNIYDVVKPKQNRTIATFCVEIFQKSNITESAKNEILGNIISNCGNDVEDSAMLEEILDYAVINDCSNLYLKLLEMHEYNYNVLQKHFIDAAYLNNTEITKAVFKEFEKSEDKLNILTHVLKHNIKLEAIKELYETILIDKENEDGETSLFIAVDNSRNVRTIEYLIKKGADPNKENKNGISPWTLAVSNSEDEIIRCFLLNCSSLKGSGDMMQTLNDYFGNTEKFNSNKTILDVAIAEGNIAFCRFLLLNGADENITSDYEKIKLYRDCETAFDEEILDLLHFFDWVHPYENLSSIDNDSLNSDAESNIDNDSLNSDDESKNNRVYTSHLLKNDNRKTIRTSIMNALVRYKNQNGVTLLHFAMLYQKVNILQILLFNGAGFNITNSWGQLPIEYDYSELMCDILKEVDRIFGIPKCYTTELQHYQRMKDKNGNTLLHYAVQQNNFRAVEILLEGDADINDQNNNKETPLSLAINENKIKIVKTLIRSSQPIIFETGLYNNLPQNDSADFLSRVKKCLYSAYNQNYEELKKGLQEFQNSADFNAVANAKMLYGAKGKIWIEEFILTNHDLLLYSLHKGLIVEVTSLCKYKEDIFVINEKNKNILFMLENIASYVTSDEIDAESVTIFCDKYFTELIAKVSDKPSEMANKIIANVRFKNEEDEGDETLLHKAVKADNEKIVKWLIQEKGANLFEKDSKDRDAYELAKLHTSSNVLKLFENLKSLRGEQILSFDRGCRGDS